MSVRIPFIRPSLPDAKVLAADVSEIVEANWYSNFGPFEHRFRAAIGDYLGIEGDRVVTVNNATTGLLAALADAVPRGDGSASIAIASFTFAAGGQAILWHGYTPAWIDIDQDTLQPSLASFKELLETGEPIAAILLTNTFGIANLEVPHWEQAAAGLGIPLIIDSAAGFGSRQPDGALIGTSGAYEIFSFHATKPFAVGEGGAVICKDAESGQRVRSFTNFAFRGSEGAQRIGLNGKLQELNAAIGLRQFETFEASLLRRREIVRRYRDAFASLPVFFPPGLESSSASFAPVTLASPEVAEEVLADLHAASIDARNYYSPALDEQPAFSRYPATVSLSATRSVRARSVSLPVLPDMSVAECERIVCTVAQRLERSTSR